MLEKLKISKPGIIPVAYWNELIDFVHTLRITSFSGGAYSRTAGGTSLWARPSGGGDGSDADHPFKLVTRAKPGDPDTVQGGILYESNLFKSLKPNDKQSITGLLSDDQSTGWFDLIGNDAVWLEVTFDEDALVTGAQINSWGSADDFDLTLDAWATDAYIEGADYQTVARKLIAYTVAGGDGKPVVSQVMRADQLLRNINADGRPARYPFDHEGGYPL